MPYETQVKVPLYARAGVVELWIEDLQENRLLVYREPTGADYKRQLALDRGATIAPLAFPDVTVSVGQLLG